MKNGVAHQFLSRHPELLDNEAARSPSAMRRLAAATAVLERYFRFTHHGLANVPEGACLLVANHSIGAVAEILLFFRAWYQHFGDRPARGLAHQVAWQIPFKYAHLEKVGAILAHPQVAEQALKRSEMLLVFPGGDLETCRPFGQRYHINLGHRSGFARLAQKAEVPIVPVVFCGSHASYIMLPGAEHLARWSGLGRFFGLKAFPLTMGCVSVAATLLFPLLLPLFGAAWLQATLPLPTRIEMDVLPPIYPQPGEDEAALAERVRQAMQTSMDRMAQNRLTPWG